MTKIIKIISSVMLFGVASACAYASQALVPNVGPGTNGSTPNANVTWPNPRFISDTASCKIDQLTGLEWVQNPTGAAVMVYTTPYINDTYNTGAGTCGHTDWRLPNIAELKSLVDYNDSTSPQNYLNQNGFQGVQSTGYWSSTGVSLGAFGNNTWYVDMSSGNIYFDPNSTTHHIWAVRGGQ